MTVAIDWQNASDPMAKYDTAEIDPPVYRETLCIWAEQLAADPDRRWVYSIDVPDMDIVDANGFPQRARSIVVGIAFSREEAEAAVEKAITRLAEGIADTT